MSCSLPSAPYPLLDARILTFDTEANNFFALMFTQGTLGVFDPGGAIPSDNLTTEPTFDNGGAAWTTRLVGTNSSVTFAAYDTHLLPEQQIAQLLENGDFEDGGTGWQASSDAQASVTFTNGTCTLTGGNNAARTARIDQVVTTPAVGSQHTIQGDVTGDTCRVRVGSTQGGSEYLEDLTYSGAPLNFTPTGTFWVQFESDGSGATTILDNLIVSKDLVGEAGIAQQVTVTQAGQPHGVRVSTAGGEEYRVRIGTAEGDGTYVDQYTSQDVFEVSFTPAGNFWITVDAYGDATADVEVDSIYAWYREEFEDIAFATPYLDSELRQLYFVETPSQNTAYVLHPKHPVYKVERDAITGVWTWTQVTFTNPPADWTTDNYPSCGAYFQGRLWLAATDTSPQTFWASKSNFPEDFSVADPLNPVDDDSLEFTLARYGRIRWLIATKNLLVGTINSEFIITSEGGVITPNDIQAEQQSSYGSAAVQPLQIGDEVIYVTPDQRKLRAMQYEWTANNWLSRDLTFFSEHITESGIRSLAWAQHPDQLLWCVLENGCAICLTYERGENIYGWHRHETQGYFREFSSGFAGGTSFLLAAVQRKAGELGIEIQDDDVYFDAADEATALGIPGSTTTTFTGFEHLAGLFVQVLLDGAVHPDVLVSDAGVITTERPGRRCEAGLKYVPKLVTLPFDQGTQTGSAQVYQKRYNKLQVTFLDSALAIINGERQPDRTPASPMDLREPDKEGMFYTRQVTLNWNQEAYVTIEQDLPLPCTVLSIAGEMSIEKL